MLHRTPAVPWLAVLACLTAAACTDDPPTQPRGLDPYGATTAFGGDEAPSGGLQNTLDARFVSIAEDVPGFGGLFLDEAGALNVYLAPAPQAVPVARLREALAGHLATLDTEITTRPFKVLAGRYSFIDLEQWRTQADAVLALEGVVFTDVDEAANRIAIGVESAAAARAVEQALNMLGVPREAVLIREIEPFHYTQTLRDYTRPVAGGLQISIPGFLCTLGFNAEFTTLPPPGRGFFTARHCWTDEPPRPYWQPFAAHSRGFIGNGFWRSPSLPLCGGLPCFLSDGAAALYDSLTSHELGGIYRTTTMGSIAIDPATPRWTITASMSRPFVGDPVDKVGRTSGWTSGVVTSTCVNVNVGGAIYLCHELAALEMLPGDSGAPVFQRIGATNNVRLAGLAFGSGGGMTVFSSMCNLRSSIGLPFRVYPGDPATTC